METADAGGIAGTGIDAVAVKPAECDVREAADLPVGTVTVDFEGREQLPAPGALADLAAAVPELRVTAPVRADGFDPLGDDSLYDALPASAKLVLVAGHPAYLAPEERSRAIAPRLGAAVDRADDPWVGTEGVERVALATGATQFALLSPSTERELRALRAAGFDGELAVYAPTVLADDPDVVLAALGGYLARRRPVVERLSGEGSVDSGATGRDREILLDAAEEWTLAGVPGDVRERVDALRDAGADHVVGYPARGLTAFAEHRSTVREP